MVPHLFLRLPLSLPPPLYLSLFLSLSLSQSLYISYIPISLFTLFLPPLSLSLSLVSTLSPPPFLSPGLFLPCLSASTAKTLRVSALPSIALLEIEFSPFFRSPFQACLFVSQFNSNDNKKEKQEGETRRRNKED